MNVEEKDDFTSVVPVIDDGDTCGNQEHLQTAQALANRTKYLRTRTDPVYQLLTGEKDSVPVALSGITPDTADVPFPNESTPFSALNPPGVMGRGLARWIKTAHEATLGLRAGNTATWFLPVQGLAPAPLANWDTVAGTDIGVALTQVATGTVPVYLTVPLPGIAGFIKEIGVYVTGGAGHAGLPGTRPRVRLIRASISGGVVTHGELAAANDGSADVTAYQTVHTIVLPNLSLNVTSAPTVPTLWTYLNITGESGSNSRNGEFKIGGFYVMTNPNP